MSVSAVPGPTPLAPASVSQVALNVQFLPGSAGALSQLTPLITADGASLQATTVSDLYEIQVPTANAGRLAALLSASPAVAYAAPQQTEQILTAPNDPGYVSGTEWQLNGTWGINVPGAWSVTTGSNGVIVADTDTGIDYNHTDLYDNVWINQNEIPSSVLPNLTDVDGDGVITFSDLNAVVNGVTVNQGPGKIVDTNGDGIITATDLLASTSAGGWASGSTQDGDTAHPDDLVGWNFVNNTDNPADGNGHGTFTAGEIGAVTNNGTGVAGTVWNAQIMAAEFLDSTGNGSDTNAAAAIEYAVNHGAKVINASWGGSGTDQIIANAIQYANQAGVIIVAAAGNNGTDDDNSDTWFSPASYSVDYPNLISVAATDSSGALASWSDYGVASVQLAAPGVNVYGVDSNGSYGYDSGTSMAAPLVTGVIALVEAAHPSWSMSQIIDAVVDTTTPDPNLVGKVTTGGIVNATAAVANTEGPYVVSGTPDGSVNNGSGLSSVVLNFNEEINPATFTPSQVTLTGPNGAISGVTVTAVSGSNDHQFTIAFPTQTGAGAYTLKVAPTLQDWYGNDLNQNRNGVNGESTDAFTETIRQTAPGSTDLLSVTGIPFSVTAGASNTLTVTALSPNGGTDTGYMGTIQFSSTDTQAGLPSSYAFTSGDAGTHTFKVKFKTAGTQAITATDTTNSAIIGTEENIIVQGAAPSSLRITGFPTTEPIGTPETFSVTAYDTYGNVAPSYTGTVRFSSSDSAASLPGNFTVSPEQQGTFTASASLTTLGAQSITATDTVTSSITGSVNVTVVYATAAVLVKQDTTTQGTWVGAYGSDGYNVIGSTSSYPSYATVSVTGQTLTSNGWATSTTDPRALEVPPSGPGRIAEAWYSSTSFSININLTDGQAHDVALYFLDWPQQGRSEQVQISDANTGKVLVTETVSNFNAGLYQQWELIGNAIITFSGMGGRNAVVSGIFFDPTPTPSPATASLVKQDTTTQGTWVGAYGSDGYNVIGSTNSYPAYATVSVTGESLTSTGWAASTTDPRALEVPPSGPGRVAEAWYSSTSFSVDVNLIGGQAHDVALYFLDWPQEGRSEQVQISDANTGRVLVTETVSNFNAGLYQQWNLSGNVKITFSAMGGNNAVLSGIFFDPTATSKPATASLVKQDTTTQGTWVGAYGSDGYNVIGSTSSYPSYATVSVTGQTLTSTGWAASTTDPRALEVPPSGPGRIAEAWYSSTSFTININLTDGQAHDVALYFLDWPQEGRSEQVQISDANTGTVLATETVSNFNAGLYQQWELSGNVNITFSGMGGRNAVVSGIFFDPPSNQSPATASLVKQDTTTQGTWVGAYGSDGYNVIGSTSSYPSYATVSVTGQTLTSNGWAAGTTDPRALEVPPTGPGRVAEAWYSSTSFTININLTDGQAHDVALYFLDWPQEGRSEQVQISDANTGTVLVTETVSNFNAGLYQQWELSGNVNITFSGMGGRNAVVSGFFFDPVTSGTTVIAPARTAVPTSATPASNNATTANPGADAIGALDFTSSSSNLDNQPVNHSPSSPYVGVPARRMKLRR